jgi:hypothetical protein
VLAGTDLVCRPLVAAGVTPGELTALTLGAAPPSAELGRLRQRRADLGLPAGDDAPLLIDPATGAAVAADAVPLHLRRARVTQAGIEANTSMCTGMLAHRYADTRVAHGPSGETGAPAGPAHGRGATACPSSEGQRGQRGDSAVVPKDLTAESFPSVPAPRG